MVFPIKFLNFFLFMDMNLTSWTGMKSDGSNHLRQTKGNGVSCLYMKFYKTAGSFFLSGHFCYSLFYRCVMCFISILSKSISYPSDNLNLTKI